MLDEAKFLGKALHVFTPKQAERVAGLILAALFGFGGIGIACWMAIREDPKPAVGMDLFAKYALIVGFAIFGPALGAVVYLLVKNHDGIHLTIFENGFVHEENETCERVLWSEVILIVEMSLGQSLGALIIRRRIGVGFSLQRNWVNDYEKLREMLLQVSQSRTIVWEELSESEVEERDWINLKAPRRN